MENYIYLYGMILATRSFKLDGDFPELDGCGIIDESHFHVGGETGTAAVVLSSLGCNLKIGGTHIGGNNETVIRDYFSNKNVDISELVSDEDFGGVVDYVFISGKNRTCFGEWKNIYARKTPWYEQVNEESIRKCSCVGFDPLLDANDTSVIDLCKKYHKKFATIDCAYDSPFSRHCEINAISHEFLENTYGKGVDMLELHRKYTEETDGLVIFTFGEKEILFGRKGQEIQRFKPYHLEVESTLGAGDSFKAGTIYGLTKGMCDGDIVKYASAIAGCACMHYPIASKPPVMDEVNKIIGA